MILLDSQVLVWVLDDNPRVGPRTRRLLSETTLVHVSAATVWELTIKSVLGKIAIPDHLAETLEQQGFVPLPITAEHAEAIRDFPEIARHDPFDRLLVAQAACAGLRMLTADRVLLGLDRDFILDAEA